MIQETIASKLKAFSWNSQLFLRCSCIIYPVLGETDGATFALALLGESDVVTPAITLPGETDVVTFPDISIAVETLELRSNTFRFV
jgi:hypothetical protein